MLDEPDNILSILIPGTVFGQQSFHSGRCSAGSSLTAEDAIVITWETRGCKTTL